MYTLKRVKMSAIFASKELYPLKQELEQLIEQKKADLARAAHLEAKQKQLFFKLEGQAHQKEEEQLQVMEQQTALLHHQLEQLEEKRSELSCKQLLLTLQEHAAKACKQQAVTFVPREKYAE
ncbi:hypothetical protein [Ectobacillus ponti]|uniref:Uncharacterized protein n=1 Tax=Ectobacillus ponti TaxID=2961894 RepID=A0AA42BUN4_9BACI|nr:hypothetical protein [Ectobacillus ponti]MCP8970693.1 hypothetical protein [Ectobacillus ponti]